MKNNVIIGSGLSALGFFENLRDQSKYIIYDKKSYPGGHAASHKFENEYFDEGAHISHTKNEYILEKFILNNSNLNIINKSNIVNFKKGKKIGYPIQSNLDQLNIIEKFYILKDIIFSFLNFKKINNYKDWCEVNYGKYISSNFYEIYTKKYWRTDPALMTNKWTKGRVIGENKLKILKNIFSKSFNKKLSYNKFYYPKNGGFQNFFIDNYKNIKINYNHEVTNININSSEIRFQNGKSAKFDNLYSSIPLPEYLNLIEEIPNNIKQSINNLKYTNLICFNLIIKKDIKLPYHWCYFYDEDIEVSRMSFLNNLKNNYYKDSGISSIQAEVFRRNDEKYDIKQIEIRVENFLRKFFILDNKNDYEITTKFIKYAYPVPLFSDKNDLINILKWLKQKNIISFGLYGTWEYMWSDQAYMHGKKLAEIVNNE